MTRKIVVLLSLAACSGPDATTLDAPNGGDPPNPDASNVVPAGTILGSVETPDYFVRTLGSGLYQFQSTVRTGLTGDIVATGSVLSGQIVGNVAVATQPYNQSGATPTFCKFDLSLGQRVDGFGTNGCTEAPRDDFTTNGIAKVPGGYRAVIQRDCTNGCPDVEESFALIKLDDAGLLDTTFGTDGILFTSILPDLSASAFAPQSTGDLIVSGYTGLYSMKLLRVHADGTLDTTFGTNGFVPNANGGRVRVLADDSIFLESTYNGVERIDRYTKDGAPLPGWGTDGRVDLKQLTQSTFDNHFNQTAADLDPEGRVVIGFSRTDTSDGPDKFYVLRLLASGALDSSFGSGGIVALDLASKWIYGIGFESDGRIIVGTGKSGGTAVHIAP